MTENTLDELFEQLDSVDEQTRLNAARSLSQMGEVGASVLARALVEYPWLEDWKERLLSIFDEDLGIGCHRQHNDLSTTFYHYAGNVLPNEEEPPLHVIQGLAYLKQDSFATILRLLDHDEALVRLGALLVLKCGLYDWEAKNDLSIFVPVLCRRLRDEEKALRVGSCVRLYGLKKLATDAIPDLVEQYRHAFDSHERSVVIKTLIELNCSKDIMRDVVVEFLKSCDRGIQTEIISSLYFSKSHENASPLIPQMMDLIRHLTKQDDYSSKCEAEKAAQCLGRIGPAAIESILELAHDPDDVLYELAFKAIGEFPMDQDGRPLARVLLDRVAPQFADGLTQSNEMKILTQIRETHGLFPNQEARWNDMWRDFEARCSSSAYLDVLIRDLFNDNNDIFHPAMLKVESLPEAQAIKITPHILNLMPVKGHRDYRFASLLRKHLDKLDLFLPEMAAVFDRIHKNFTEKNDFFKVIQAMGSTAVPLLPQVLQLLGNENAELRGEGLNIITSIGPIALDHTPDLIEILSRHLDDPEETVIINAIEALGVMGAAARPIAPRLMELVQADSIGTVGAAKEALSRIALAHLSAKD